MALEETGAEAGKGGLALRILRYPVVLAIVEFVVVVLAATLASNIARRTLYVKDNWLELAGALIVAAGTIGGYIVCRQLVEGNRGSHEFAAQRGARELAGGLAYGFALFTVAFAIVALAGSYAVTGRHWPGDLWAMLSMAVVSGVTEETLFRGVLFRHIEQLLGSWGALAITSAFFGLAHITNPNSSAFAAFAIAVEAGLLLGAAYMLTRRLWLAIGIHAGWNFTQGWVFGIPVSGSNPQIGLLSTARSGPDWLTGGAFGLEASVVALIVATSGGLYLLRRAIGQGQLVKPVWQRKAAG